MKKIASELLSVAKDVLAEGTSIFDSATVNEAIEKMKNGIKAPYVSVGARSLGGAANLGIYLSISLDDKKDWVNNIKENSRYYLMSFQKDGTLELFSGGLREVKFRKTKAKSVDDAIAKINKFNEAAGKIAKW